MGFFPLAQPDPLPVKEILDVEDKHVEDLAILHDAVDEADTEGERLAAHFRLQRYVINLFPQLRGWQWNMNWTRATEVQIIQFASQIDNPLKQAIDYIQLRGEEEETLLEAIDQMDGSRQASLHTWRWIMARWPQVTVGSWAILIHQASIYLIKVERGDDEGGDDPAPESPPDPGLAKERPQYRQLSEKLPGVVTADMIIGAGSPNHG